MQRTQAHEFAERIGAIDALDAPAATLAKGIRALMPTGGGVKDALSGSWLGHALHPLLTDVPIGAWTSATVLDLAGGRAARPAARRLVGVGLVAAAPTALTGWSEWVDSERADEQVRRIGIVHAIANGSAIALYGASYAARRRGAHALGVLLGLGGASALVAGGWLGGELAYTRGVGVNETLFADEPRVWTAALDASQLVENRPTHAIVGDRDILLVKRNGTVHALADRCSHRGGALHEGALEGDCIACPVHGTRFRLEDGTLERGPSAYPQPVYEARIKDGRVEIRAGEPA